MMRGRGLTGRDNFRKPQAKNVMIRSFRSRTSRNLEDKYLVDWRSALGEGAFGQVYLARNKSSNEEVALKKIDKRYTDTDVFRTETAALLRIHANHGHPNICGLRDMYESNDHYFLVFDLVPGGEMFEHLINYGAYSEADASRLMREVASALAFLVRSTYFLSVKPCILSTREKMCLLFLSLF